MKVPPVAPVTFAESVDVKPVPVRVMVSALFKLNTEGDADVIIGPATVSAPAN